MSKKQKATTLLMAMSLIQATAQTQHDSILWEKQLETITIKGTRSQIQQKNGAIVENSGMIIDRFVSNHHDLDLTYATSKMTYYGKIGYANYQSYWKETDTSTHYANDGNTYRSSSTLTHQHGFTDQFHWSAGMDYAFSSDHTVGVKYDGYTAKQPMPYHMTSFAETNGKRNDEVTGENKFFYDNWQHHVNAFYKFISPTASIKRRSNIMERIRQRKQWAECKEY